MLRRDGLVITQFSLYHKFMGEIMTKVSRGLLSGTNTLILERKGGNLTIWLNRPEVKNALSIEMTEGLNSTLKQVENDRTIRTIVLRGKGGFFCAGADLKDFQSVAQQGSAIDVAKGNRSFGFLMSQLNEQPQVVIILVEGAAIGGGLGLACVADVTLVMSDARFRLSETSLGIPPAQIAPFVTERVGLMQARRLMLTGARFNGDDAVALGIAHDHASSVDELEAKGEKILHQISACAPEANAVTKSILFETLRKPRGEALDFAAERFAGCILGQEGQEGVSAFVEKRRPYWVSNLNGESGL
jgi:isohexenylglutaconyl-CoA hydratase|tara:strand:+ start:8664 stop:9569 length:906 start_codon:yes stop_codon:yes gene_type:complete